MSFRVLVIPEDPTWNGYILKPLVDAVLAAAGKPKAKTQILSNPKTQGYDQAVKAIRGPLFDLYGFYDAWIFIPDADRASPDAMARLEGDLAARNVRLLCCPAVPEVEIYACLGYRDELPSWEELRRHLRFKEAVFEPLLRQRGNPRAAGEGREQMIERSLQNPQLLFERCPELARLRDRLAALHES